MMTTKAFLIYLIVNILNTYIVSIFLKAFLGEHIKNKYIYRFHLLLYNPTQILIYLFITTPIINLFINILFIYCLTFNFDTKNTKRITSAIEIYAIFMLVETAFAISNGFLNAPMDQPIQYYESDFSFLVTNIISYIIALIFKNYKYLKSDILVPKIYSLLIFILPLLTIVVIFILTTSKLSFTHMLIALGAMLFINTIVFYLFNTILKDVHIYTESLKISNQNKYYLTQYELMKSNNEQVKLIQHDFKNFVQMFDYLLQHKEYDLLSQQLKKFSDKTLCSEYMNSGNYIIDGILNYKIQYLISKNIKYTMDLQIPNDLNIDSDFITIVLGNLLDNAITAADKSDASFVNFAMKYNQGRIFIKLENSYSNDLIYDEHMNFTSTKTDKINHGLGIQSVKKVLSENNGEITFDLKPAIFTAHVMIYTN